MSIQSEFPTLRIRRALSGTVAAVAIVGIIIVGGIIIYFLIITPSGPSISPYP